MKWLRNREIRKLLCIMLLITMAAVVITHAFLPIAAVAAGAGCLLLDILFLMFVRRQYRQLSALADYLKRVNDGEYALELPDNEEGELSILKSEIYKVTVSLNERSEQLKRDKLQLADALSDISHQFKTPLTSMSVMTELLEDSNLDESRRNEFTAQLQLQLKRLTWLTNALLTISRLDAESVSFRSTPVPLSRLIEKAFYPIRISMELKEQTVSVQAGKGTLSCDENWTAEALTNILKNCTEHTPVGGEIHVFASSNVLFTEIKVRDSGPGIDKADLPYLFDRFYKGKSSADNSVGIGLAMAKSIVQAQGGTLGAKNALEGGAEFILRFPKK